MPTPENPQTPSRDRTLASLIATSGFALVPGIGGVLQPWAQAALERGQKVLLEQFFQEVADTLRRHEERIGHVELDAFMARPSAAASLNTALGLAARTPSREKHRLLAQALINGAAAEDDDALLPYLWSLVERHSALDIRILHFLSDPVNLAIRAGYHFEGDPVWGQCLFTAFPELRYGRFEKCDGMWELIRDIDEKEDSEDETYFDVPEHDPSTPPGPYYLYWNSMHRLNDDRLIDIPGNQTVDDHLRDCVEATLSLRHERPGEDGLYPGRPFESLTEMGARYLAFLTEPPARAMR